MDWIKVSSMTHGAGAVLVVAAVLFCGCGSASGVKTGGASPGETGASSTSVFSFDDAAVAFPSPASVKLGPEGRFDERFKGNINYLRYQHEYYGDFMLESFATRHYRPGRLLERVWDGEYAGKWLDAATRTAVNTGDETMPSHCASISSRTDIWGSNCRRTAS